MNVSEDGLLNLITWCLVKTTFNLGQAPKTSTSIGNWLNENAVSFVRKNLPTFKCVIDGYYKRRPPTIQRKKPFCCFRCELMFRCVNVHDFNVMNASTVVLVAYESLLSPSEMAHSYQSKNKLPDGHITFIPHFKNPKEIAVLITNSKTNQQNKRLEKLATPCTYTTNEKVFCIVHGLRTLYFEETLD